MAPAPNLEPPNRESLARVCADWAVLCQRIGDRRAGGSGERRAAEFIRSGFEAAGWEATTESFPCTTLKDNSARVAAWTGRRWEDCPARCFVGSAPTGRGASAEGAIAWLDLPEAFHRLGPGSLRGSVAVAFGPMPEEPGLYRRLIAAAPLAILSVDDRLPFSWPKSDALFPHWVRRHGSLPVAAIPYATAWRWRAGGVARARVRLRIRHAAGRSENVVAYLPGADSALPGLLLCAHHDTQPGTVGADDNASGVVLLLEAARRLARGGPRQRALRLVSFGAEEQLSVGAARYVERHRRQLGRVGLVVNLDSVSSPLGHTSLFHSGHRGLARHFQSGLRRGGCDVGTDASVCPYADHFPFTALGVPAVWLYRWNVRGGARWQHHGPRDTLPNVSAPTALGLLDALLPLVSRLADSRRWPFGRPVPAPIRSQTRRLALELFGLRP